MVTTVNLHEAKTHLSRLLERAKAGEEIIIAKAGKPYVRLTPVEPPRPRELGFLARPGLVIDDERLFAPMTEEELSEWEDSPLSPPDCDEGSGASF